MDNIGMLATMQDVGFIWASNSKLWDDYRARHTMAATGRRVTPMAHALSNKRQFLFQFSNSLI